MPPMSAANRAKGVEAAVSRMALRGGWMAESVIPISIRGKSGAVRPFAGGVLLRRQKRPYGKTPKPGPKLKSIEAPSRYCNAIY